MPVFLSVIFNGLSFLVFESGSVNFYLPVTVSFAAAQAVAYPLNAVNDLMKKESLPAEKSKTQKNDFGNAQDFAQNNASIVFLSLSISKMRFLHDNFIFLSSNKAVVAGLGVSPERTKCDFTGLLCLFAFLLMYFALLKKRWTINNSLIIKENAAA